MRRSTSSVNPYVTLVLIEFELGPSGWAAAVGAGAAYGLGEGIDCVRSGNCMTCVFSTGDPNDPCYQP